MVVVGKPDVQHRERRGVGGQKGSVVGRAALRSFYIHQH